MLIHKGKDFEDKFAKDGSLPDPASTTNPEFKCVLQTITDSSGVDPKTWTKRPVVVMGVSEETSTGVHRLTEMADKGELLFPMHAMIAKVRWCSCTISAPRTTQLQPLPRQTRLPSLHEGVRLLPSTGGAPSER